MNGKPIEIFTALDLEMNQPSGKIIQIGACVGNVITGEIYETFSIFINPNETINPFITDLTKITQFDVDNGVSLEEGYNKLKKMHENYGSFMNPITWGGGDSQSLLEQIKIENPHFEGWIFGRRWIDAKTLFISWRIANRNQIQGGLARSMTKLSMNFVGQKHNAKDDAVNTFKIYNKLLCLLKQPEA